MYQLVRKTAFLMCLILTFFAADAAAGTGVRLEANHRVLSSVDDGTGFNAVTLELTLTNAGSTDLTSVSLEVVPDRQLLVPYGQYLTVPSIPAGATVAVNWTVNSIMPGELWGSGILVRFHGEATDSAGQTVVVSSLSHPAQ